MHCRYGRPWLSGLPSAPQDTCSNWTSTKIHLYRKKLFKAPTMVKSSYKKCEKRICQFYVVLSKIGKKKSRGVITTRVRRTKAALLRSALCYLNIYRKKKQLKKVYEKLHNAHQHMKVYLKKDLPDYLHRKNNPRTAPLLILADQGWLINTGFEDHVYFKTSSFERGEHDCQYT